MDENFVVRFEKWVNLTGINPNQITVKAGLPIGLVGKLLNGGKGLSVENIEKILYAYPDLNVDWLITGRGEMLLKDNSTTKKPLIVDEMPTIREIMSDQRKEIAELNQQVGALKDQIKRLEKKCDDDSFRNRNVIQDITSNELKK